MLFLSLVKFGTEFQNILKQIGKDHSEKHLYDSSVGSYKCQQTQ